MAINCVQYHQVNWSKSAQAQRQRQLSIAKISFIYRFLRTMENMIAEAKCQLKVLTVIFNKKHLIIDNLIYLFYKVMVIPPKFIFVTGGVMSGLGKGIVTSSTAKLLQLCGLKVSCVKIDPYVNYDAGTMNPLTHGEVFVTDDGGECDMDVGNYERFLDINLTSGHNITTGRIFSNVIKSEREGKYLGQCVQIIPHITDEIKNQLREISMKGTTSCIGRRVWRHCWRY